MKSQLKKLAMRPELNKSGNFQIKISAISKEKQNHSRTEAIEKVNIYIEAKADLPKPLSTNTLLPKLKEDGSIGLNEIFVINNSKEVLHDIDGSEQLRVQINISNDIKLVNRVDNDWVPLNTRLKSNEVTEYMINYSDIEDLSLKDNGIRSEYITFNAATLSKEISNGGTSVGEETKVTLEFIRNAKVPEIEMLEASEINEDSDGWMLNSLITIKKENENDLTYLQIEDIPEEVYIQSIHGNIVNNKKISVEDLSDIIIKPKDNVSGQVNVKFEVISEPNGGGNSARSGIRELNLSIAGIADEPTLELNNSSNQVSIGPTGWLDIGNIIKSIKSPDNDGSEQLFILLSSIDEKGKNIPFPIDSKLSTLSGVYNQNNWEIDATEGDNLKLYLGIIDELMTIKIGVRSKEGTSFKDGNSVTIEVPSNNILKAPILEITSDLYGKEDEYIPLMQKQGGVIKAELREQRLGLNLNLKLSEIDNGISLVRKKINNDGDIEYSSPLNDYNPETKESELTLEYSQWENI